MARLAELLSLPARLWRQQREITQLREELARLRAQNDSMREGMRRCVTCEYRLDVRQRQDAALGDQDSGITHSIDDQAQ